MIDVNWTNIMFGIAILLINLFPLFTKSKYFSITLPISVLLAAIKVLFLN